MNRNTGEITFPKSKYNRWTRRHMCAQDHEADRQYQSSEMLQHYMGNRKRLTLRHFEKMIDKWARLPNIQRCQSLKPSGKEYHLITLMGLREASSDVCGEVVD